jgi:hypothetical protein
MATTYQQLETISRDGSFQLRVLWAARKAAEDITNNPAASATQKKWADKIRRNTFDNRQVLGLACLMMRNATLQGAVSEAAGVVTCTATDSDLQFVCNSLINVDADLAVLM